METKFVITLLISFGFLGLYWLTKKRAQALDNAEIIEATVTEVFLLDQTNPTFNFTVDRAEAFGNFVKIQYQHNGQTKTFDSTLINKAYTVGQTLHIKRLSDQQIILCDENNHDKKMTLSFLAVFFILFCAALIGIAIPLFT